MSYKIDLLSILEVSKRNEEERKEREKKDEKDNYKKLVQTHIKKKVNVCDGIMIRRNIFIHIQKVYQ